MAFELPALAYEKDTLEPVISRNTLDFHYGKHHHAYVNNLNTLIIGSKFENASLEEIILQSEGGIFNNASQVWNHSFYFEALCPKDKQKIPANIETAIEREFGSFAEFKEQFSKAAATLFGSGWVWLVLDKAGKMQIVKESNAGNPLTKGFKPLLTLDVWEHAYYLDYQNKRPDYIAAIWSIVNWEKVNERLIQAWI